MTLRMRRIACTRNVVLALAFLAVFPSAAQANMGLPMIAIFLPPMWLALVPIMIVEALVIARATGTSVGRAIGGTSIANVVSTIIGVPLLWCLLAGLQLAMFGSAAGLHSQWTKLYAVTVQSPWLIPYEDQFYWMIPAAAAVLAVPFALLSTLIEAPIVRKIAGLDAIARAMPAILLANALSYAGLWFTISAIQYFDWGPDLVTGPFAGITMQFVDMAFHIAQLLVKPGS